MSQLQIGENCILLLPNILIRIRKVQMQDKILTSRTVQVSTNKTHLM